MPDWFLEPPPPRRNWLPGPEPRDAPVEPASAPGSGLSRAERPTAPTGEGEIRNADAIRHVSLGRDFLEATRPFRVRYDGQVIDVNAGERFKSGHAVTRVCPEFFKPSGLRRGDVGPGYKAPGELTNREIGVLQGVNVIRTKAA